MPFSELTKEVASSRRGARTAAFFDFDGTLIHGFSVFFFLYRRYLSGKVTREEAVEQLQAVASYALSRSDFTGLLADFCSGVAGVSDHEMWSLA